MIRSTPLREVLRQLLAVLDNERQALAGLAFDDITIAAQQKLAKCEEIEKFPDTSIDEECRAMLQSARNMNETNRQIRNLVAANIEARINMLTGSPHIYGRSQRAAFRG